MKEYVDTSTYPDVHEDPDIYYISETVDLKEGLGNCKLGLYTHANKDHCNDEPYFFLENENGIQSYIDLRDNKYYKNGQKLSDNQINIFNDFIQNGYTGDLNWSIWDKLVCYWKSFNIDSDYFDSVEDIKQPDYSTIKED